jgi:DNA-directed RNA polymerase subunit M/transcription elongation factor TFIIS
MYPDDEDFFDPRLNDDDHIDVCPKCHSLNILDTQDGKLEDSGKYTWFECHDCLWTWRMWEIKS